MNNHEQKAQSWIARNPTAYSILCERSRAHASNSEKFSIRQLCEKLRWERDQGIHKGSESYAIPNEITRYVGIQIMRDHPSTEEWMTTKMPTDNEVSQKKKSASATVVSASNIPLVPKSVDVTLRAVQERMIERLKSKDEIRCPCCSTVLRTR